MEVKRVIVSVHFCQRNCFGRQEFEGSPPHVTTKGNGFRDALATLEAIPVANRRRCINGELQERHVVRGHAQGTTWNREVRWLDAGFLAWRRQPIRFIH